MIVHQHIEAPPGDFLISQAFRVWFGGGLSCPSRLADFTFGCMRIGCQPFISAWKRFTRRGTMPCCVSLPTVRSIRKLSTLSLLSALVNPNDPPHAAVRLVASAFRGDHGAEPWQQFNQRDTARFSSGSGSTPRPNPLGTDIMPCNGSIIGPKGEALEIQVHAFDLDGLWQRCREVHGRREARSEIWRVWGDRHIARVSQCKDLLHLANATNLGDTGLDKAHCVMRKQGRKLSKR
jgi:hypothetical protein